MTATPAYEQPCYRSWHQHENGMRVQEAVIELERAIAEDAECNFAREGISEGLVLDRAGRHAVVVLVRLDAAQVAYLKRRMPEVSLLHNLSSRQA